MSFLAPLLFAGSLMLIAPWVFHRIRKPQQKAVVFGSMMFVPQVKKKVLEKKAIQHWLLMLLRMLLLLILVLAFARPYRMFVAEATDDDGAARHWVLLDNSYSLGADGLFESAKERASAVVNTLAANERVGLIVFNQSVEGEYPIVIENESPQDNRRRIRQAIDASTLSQSGTAYLPALQRAQELLLANRASDDEEAKKVIHIVSDFQQSGMPPQTNDWRASAQVELKLEPIENTKDENFSISDIAVRKAPQGGFRVLGQIKNGTDKEASREVALVIDGAEVERKSVAVQPGHSMKVSFKTDWDIHKSQAGYLALPDDDLLLDNKRYFAWNPQSLHQVALFEDATDNRRWPAAWFVEQALRISGDSVWTIEKRAVNEMASYLNDENSYAAVLAPTLNALTQTSIDRLQTYLEQGGKAMAWIDPMQTVNQDAAAWIASLGMNLEGPRFETANDDQFDILSWIDFDHAIFFPMRDIEFNDFTMVHFYQYIKLTLDETGDGAGKALARFDKTHPALIEAPIGEGRLLLWTFSPTLDATNLPRNPKFVPVMFEALNELIGARQEKIEYAVGDPLRWGNAMDERLEWAVELPEETSALALTRDGLRQDAPMLPRAGVVSWRRDGSDEAYQYAVNIDASESDSKVVLEDVFIRALGSSALVQAYNIEQLAKERAELDEQLVKVEYGWWALMVLLIGLIAEGLYASLVSRREWKKQASVEG
ncbi:MAG: BatA and WFA domain-containing protein [Candidatus Hinthialibacter antarcticus]|nr:BatA and WFA domain-containing protein [Candidatus Hinthialibacter antarcticus]